MFQGQVNKSKYCCFAQFAPPLRSKVWRDEFGPKTSHQIGGPTRQLVFPAADSSQRPALIDHRRSQ